MNKQFQLTPELVRLIRLGILKEEVCTHKYIWPPKRITMPPLKPGHKIEYVSE